MLTDVNCKYLTNEFVAEEVKTCRRVAEYYRASAGLQRSSASASFFSLI